MQIYRLSKTPLKYKYNKFIMLSEGYALCRYASLLKVYDINGRRIHYLVPIPPMSIVMVSALGMDYQYILIEQNTIRLR
jgi:uncharacterized membrane protein YdfJ with MMPL/SSD domain